MSDGPNNGMSDGTKADHTDAPAPDPIDALEAWRARGAAVANPVALRIVEALARRAAAQQGEARQWMLQRVGQLIDAHGAAVTPAADATHAAPAADRSATRRAALAGLSALVDRLGRPPAPASAAPPAGARKALSPHAPPHPQPQPPRSSSLNAVTAFKGTWSRLRADQRLRQAVSQVPAMAGPLNSSHVVNRTLQAMRELSPEYLEAFMAQVDTLMWLERASGGNLAPRSAATKESKRAPRAP